ncbi:hypothetical protein DBV15_12527, partial [Temnothorax longispinosus]
MWTRAVTEGRAKLLEKYWEESQQALTQIKLHASTAERTTLPYFTESQLTRVEESYLTAYNFFQERLASYSLANAGGGTTVLRTVPRTTFVVQPGAVAFHESSAFKLPTIIAWNILKNHYKNKRSIIDAHLTNFFAIKTVTSGDAVNGLKSLRASSTESLNAMRALQRLVDEWNDILVFCLVQKLDKHSRREWEVHLENGSDYPTIEKLTKFLDTRIRSLEAAESILPIDKSTESAGKKEGKNSHKISRSHHGTVTDNCVVCSEAHKINQCEKFKSKSIPERQNSFSCYHCKRRHHSLLHEHKSEPGPSTISPAPNSSSKSDSKSNTSKQSDSNATHAHVATQARAPTQAVLLATVWVHLESEQGRQIQARALIDPGSDASFVSKNQVQWLRLRCKNTNAYVASIGGRSVSTVKATASLLISSIQDPTRGKLECQALVLPKITAYVPTKVPLDMAFTKGLTLADPKPTSLATIELLLGADLYADVVLEGILKETPSKLILQNTIFGWIISGVARIKKLNKPKVEVGLTRCTL